MEKVIHHHPICRNPQMFRFGLSMPGLTLEYVEEHQEDPASGGVLEDWACDD
jgi:hypothetical protein